MLARHLRRLLTTLLAVVLALPRALAARPVASDAAVSLPSFLVSILQTVVERDLIRGYEGIIQWSAQELSRSCVLLFIVEQSYNAFLTVSIAGALLMWLSPLQEAFRLWRSTPSP
mmetsp:Transcript_63658/g.151833  ORF Transcript_63658/g.151833 Transcript_63658/m.151833 type:complete len:115 (+) Transcript_63658:83-427(+)